MEKAKKDAFKTIESVFLTASFGMEISKRHRNRKSCDVAGRNPQGQFQVDGSMGNIRWLHA